MQVMEVVGIRVERAMNAPVLVLRDRHDGDLLPIWIGPHEADAIADALGGRVPPRPMTHDIVTTLLEAAGGGHGWSAWRSSTSMRASSPPSSSWAMAHASTPDPLTRWPSRCAPMFLSVPPSVC